MAIEKILLLFGVIISNMAYILKQNSHLCHQERLLTILRVTYIVLKSKILTIFSYMAYMSYMAQIKAFSYIVSSLHCYC